MRAFADAPLAFRRRRRSVRRLRLGTALAAAAPPSPPTSASASALGALLAGLFRLGGRVGTPDPGCVNNLKQLSFALKMYAGDNDGYFPPRTNSNRWPTLLQESYKNLNVLICSTDATRGTPLTETGAASLADRSPRSYLINGWNDYFKRTLPDTEFTAYMQAESSRSLKQTQIPHPSDTVLFGEKKSASQHYFMDLIEPGRSVDFPGMIVGNDESELEQGRHSGGGAGSRSGGSNYAMVDGSARFVKYWHSVGPLNLWCVLDEDRASPTYALSF